MSHAAIQKKVASIAGVAIQEKGYATTVDVLLGLGWLTPEKLNDWRRGRVPYLERVVGANLSKISVAMKAFRTWAAHSKLKGSETVYNRWGKGPKQALRFSKSGNPTIELAYRTHFVLIDHPKLAAQHLHASAPATKQPQTSRRTAVLRKPAVNVATTSESKFISVSFEPN